MTGLVLWVFVGWVAGCVTTTTALWVWSLILDSREQEPTDG